MTSPITMWTTCLQDETLPTAPNTLVRTNMPGSNPTPTHKRAIRRPRSSAAGASAAREHRGAALSLLLLLLLLAPAGCRTGAEDDAGEGPATAVAQDPGSTVGNEPDPTAAVIVRPQVAPPVPNAPRLAQMAVFPSTSSPLEVLNTQPADGAEGTAVGVDEARIVLRFNHPVVPLAGYSDREQGATPVTIEPPLAGEGQWLDTATWVFEPSEALSGSTQYTVTVDPLLEDVLGGTLSEPHAFSFITAAPSVLRSLPANNARYIGATSAISITFTQAMEPEGTAAAFSLADVHGTDIGGEVSFLDEGRTLLFQPDEPLARERAHVARIAAGAPAATGEAVTQQVRLIRFTVSPYPTLVSSTPEDGQSDVRLGYGAVELRFNTPMDQEAVTVTLRPTLTRQVEWWDEDGLVLNVSGGWQASTPYTLTLPAGARSAHGEAISETHRIAFSLGPMEPAFSLATEGPFGLYQSGDVQELWLSAVNRESVPLRLYNVPRDDLLSLTTGRNVWDYQPEEADLLRSWVVDTSGKLNQWRTVSTTLVADGSSLAAGAYLVDATEGDRREKAVLLVSELNLTLKATPEEVVVWVTDMSTGRPAADIPIAVYEPGDRLLVEGLSDSEGLLRAPIERESEPWEQLAAVSERDGVVVAAVGGSWNDGIGPWEFGLPFTTWRPGFAANLYTDRPIYRSGQTVHYRGVLRHDDDLDYRLPEPDALSVELIVFDPNHDTVLEKEIDLSDFGSFNGDIVLDETAPLGGYRIEARVLPKPETGGQDGEDEDAGERKDVREPLFSFSGSFRVAAYRKPAYEVTVGTDRDRYLDGEEIQVTVDAAYYFGGPVADADVRWRLMSDDYLFQPDVDGWWDFVDYDLRQDRSSTPRAAVISEGVGRTDAQGRFETMIPASLSETPLSQVFTIDVELVDLDNQAVSSRGSVVVDSAELYVGLRPASYVGEAGEPSEVEILSLDTEGQALPDQEVAISAYSREWFSVREKREDGAFYWSSSYTDTLVAEQVATTDDSGRASIRWTPAQAGVHRIEASAIDSGDREARSATYQWIVQRGGSFVNWSQDNHDRIDLVADKRSYEPGDTARVLVPAPFADATGLLTIERGRVRDVRVLRLPTNSETIEIPISADMSPNAYVSLVLVKGIDADHPTAQLKLGYTNLNVTVDERLLTLKITPDRERYGPRETVRWQLEAQDAQGQPVEAELSAALVDRALLALAEDPAPSLVDAFYGQRPLSVETSASLTESIDRLNQALEAKAKGGGGGLGQEQGGTVRRLFQDTAYWEPSLITDDEGKASFETTLPDNLTTWRLDVRGVTAGELLVGGGRSEIVATRPVLLQPVLPRFVVLGDNLQLEAVIHNGSGEARSLEVDLATVGLDVLGESSHGLEIPAGGKAEVRWQVTAPQDGEGLSGPTVPEAIGEAVVRMSVRDADAADREDALDAVELTLPAYTFLAAETVATSGEVDDRLTETIAVPEAGQARQPELRLELQPSLAAASLDGLDFLRFYPYDCTEQTVSRFLPNIATLETLRRLAIDRPELDADLEQQLQLGLQRLYATQQADGGWGWCANATSSTPWLSAYALLGLTLAEEAGFEVRSDVAGGAETYLVNQLNRRTDATHVLDRHAFYAWVLARRGALAPSRAVRLWEQRAGLGLDGKAFLALALGRSGPEQQPRVSGLLADLSAAAQLSATGASWHDAELDRYAMASDTRTSAIVLLALAQLDPENVHLGDGVRWLLVARSAEHWETTQETAWAVLALAEVMTARGELEPAYDYFVELNGQPVSEGEVSAASVDRSTRLDLGDSLEPGAENSLTLIRRGAGRLYYSAFLRTFPTAQDAPPVDEGIVLGRRYLRVDPATYEPTGEAVDRVAIGDTVQVQLTMVSDRVLHYVKLEDPLPAGLEPIDSSLATTSAAVAAPSFEEIDREEEPLQWWMRGWWSHWSHSELRDDRVVLFADRLPRGAYEYTYLARASLAGDFHVMPAQAEQIYAPEVFGRSAGGVFSVER